jgi:hypothetical protein
MLCGELWRHTVLHPTQDQMHELNDLQ